MSGQRSFAIPILCGLFLLASAVTRAEAPTGEPFGTSADGKVVPIFKLTNTHGMTVTVMSRGPSIVEIIVPDKSGKSANVNLALDDYAGYETRNPGYGSTIGRVAGRIRDSKYTLNGQEVVLRSKGHIIHGGGERALSRIIWDARPFENENGQGVAFTYTSPDGEEGFPGSVNFTVTIQVATNANEIHFDYKAVPDRPTPINLTNHAYFNLAGEGSGNVLDHELQIFADQWTLVDDALVQTGEIADVAGLAIDFREPRRIGERIEEVSGRPFRGYDHNFIIRGAPGTMRPMCRLKDPNSGRVLEIESTQPSLEVYTGNHLEGAPGKQGKTYVRYGGIALETQHDPNAANLPNLPSMIATPERPYHEQAIWRFLAE